MNYNQCKFRDWILSKNYTSRYLLISFSVLLILGCSSEESKIYDSFKCAKVARMIGNDSQALKALEKAEPYLNKISGSQARYAMFLSQKFSDDLELFRYSGEGKMKIINETYQSNKCQSLYE